MKIKINGQTLELTSKLTSEQSSKRTIEHSNETPIYVDDALTKYFNNQQQSTFALALNGDFIGRDDYCSTPVKANDNIDILFPIQGG
ncbi:MAG: sulfur carrier protein ThiS [Alteromonadaceae bacterium]|nr:sulfur carrier protein ThiS [Alteromonadaceae bacterium]